MGIFTLALSVMTASIAIYHDVYWVLMAIGITAALCLGLTLFSFQTKIDFTGIGKNVFIIHIVLSCLIRFIHSRDVPLCCYLDSFHFWHLGHSFLCERLPCSAHGLFSTDCTPFLGILNLRHSADYGWQKVRNFTRGAHLRIGTIVH